MAEGRVKYDAWANITIGLGSLAVGAGRGSSPIDNPLNRAAALVLFSPMTHTVAPTADTIVEWFLLRQDDSAATSGRTDLWTAADAALTIINSQQAGVVGVPNTAAVNVPDIFDTAPLGPLDDEWGMGVRNGTTQILHATASNHKTRYRYYLPDNQ